MLSNVEARSAQLMRGLVLLTKKYPIIDVRGRGLMVGVEFGGRDGSRKAEKGVAVVSRGMAEGRGSGA
jgi:4-aminobutyrate aminotransferase-like enzyme